ncbi:hypothetical protein [Nubsella zeaxanthinifaciens]|uniref:hypothetical protein n=1 Tax=Nubsella zeaxanthinifaciens TaxID=392412 RepID=UPI000DE44463|nr:hypothetical protein [Nubsella zeaxanthinifaciens]
MKKTLSPEQIEELKNKYPQGLWELTVEDKVAYVRKPTREEMRSVIGMATTDPLGMSEQILNDCFVAGDEEIKTDDDYFYGAAQQLQNLIQIKSAELKKL